MRGFEAGYLDLQLETQPEPRVTLTSPAGARLIKCAVFTCQPEVVVVESDGNPAEESPNGASLHRIDNVPGCVHDIWAPSPPSRTSFAFPTTRSGGNVATSECVAEGEAYADRAISMVAVGCWAFDDHRVLAASELVPVPPALAQVFLPIRLGCGLFGETCYDEAGGFYGACADGECRPRCASAADCDNSLGAQQPCAWRCAGIAHSSVGVCVRL